MTTSRITCKYTVPVLGTMTAAAMQNAMAAVAVDNNFLLFRGLYVLSDTTTTVASSGIDTIVRTIVLSVGPNLDQSASITAELYPGGASSSPIKDLVVNSPGITTYVRVPVLQISDLGGEGAGAQGHVELGVTQTGVISGGANYTNQTTATATGGQLAVGGEQATFSVTIAGGVIQSIDPITAGGPYNIPPTIVIADPGGGSGGSAGAVLGVVNAVLDTPGQNYVNPQTTLTPYFLHMCPTTGAQIAAAQGFMTNVLQQALGVTVVAATPTLL